MGREGGWFEMGGVGWAGRGLEGCGVAPDALVVDGADLGCLLDGEGEGVGGV